MGGASRLLMLLSTPIPRLCPRSYLFRLAQRSQTPPSSLAAVLAAQRRFLSFISQPRHGFRLSAHQMHTQASVRVDSGESSVSPTSSEVAVHPWPEWLKLVDHLTAGGYADRQLYPVHGEDDDSFLVSVELPEDFRRLAGACLSYARERPDLLRYLPKKDIEVVVENGSPFLFKNALNSVRRMKSFISSDGNQELEHEQAHTLDVMRYLLSYASNSLSSIGGDDTRCRELVESSVRNLLHELVKANGGIQESNISESTARHTPFGYERSTKSLRQNIEMKRGDWICPKCNFMNFARNMKCLECDEARPKRQMTGGEWECPQCDFFNYGRNMTCLRCDCKRPGEVSSNGKPNIEQLLNSGNVDRAEIECRLAENDEKAERWFSKVSQLDDSSDLSSAIADEDFPEIMPLRKGTNRFVISTRKTPLERRMTNAQYRSNLSSDKMSEAMGQTLDRILGRTSAASGNNPTATSGTTKDAENQLVSGEPSTTESRFTSPERRDSGYVPSSAIMFHKKPSTEVQQMSGTIDFASVKSDHLVDTVAGGFGSGKANEYLHSGDLNLTGCEKVNNETASKAIKDLPYPTESWSKRSAQAAHLPKIANLQNTTSDNGFQNSTSTHEEESRFVMDNKGDHSLTLQHYKRRMAMDQANNSNFVPFVPFPPDYFAKKDKQPEAGSSTQKYATVSSGSVAMGDDKNISQRFQENRIGHSQGGANTLGQSGSPKTSGDSWDRGLPGTRLDERKVPSLANDTWKKNPSPSGALPQEVTADGVSASGNLNGQQIENPQKTGNWNHGFPGKSLEGSAVTEPDPLDMSEEAKAQRWFRRVAQIKDISELSKIPDEDFPEIMPMRKGVNRFVVSKRKTPLERRLTSPQYRRNLPIVSSEPGKDSTRE